MIEREIRTLLDAPAAGPDAPPLARMEHTLTSGYAHALALEAEGARLERRIAELATGLDDPEVSLHSSELRTLSRRLEAATAEVRHLRALLAELRTRLVAARAAA